MHFYFPQDKFCYEKKCKCKDKEGSNSPCYNNSVIFYVAYCQFLWSGLVVITAKPFKKPVYTNITLFIFIIIIFCYVFYIMIYNDAFSSRVVGLTYFPDDDFLKYYNKTEYEEYKDIIPHLGMPFKYYLCIFCFLNFIVCLIYEKVIVSYLIRKWSKKVYDKNKEKLRKEDIEPTLDLIYDVKTYVKENSKKRRETLIQN